MITETAIVIALSAVTLCTALILKLRSQRAAFQAGSAAAHARYEQEITIARNESDRLLDALGDAFLLVDADSQIRFANAAAHALFNHRTLVGRPFREAMLDPRVAEALLQCLRTGDPVQARVVLPQQASPRGDLETRGLNAWIIDAARMPEHPDSETRTRVIIRDVTAEHQTEQIRKDFVANASHELRTPMAIISGYLENLLDDGMLEDTHTARRFLSVMRKHADRISRIVEDMLVISRLESGEAGSLKIEPFRLRPCVNDVLERLESLIQSKQAQVVVLMEDEHLTLTGDRFYWTQVLFNLVENSLKQNPQPGLLLEIGGESTPDQFRVWVADNGIGIPSDDLPHIFRRFYRVEKHHSQQEIKGTGLGLSIVKRAIEAHGGRVSVSSTPGRETKFLITLPKEGSASVSGAETAA